ncbi:MAG: 3-phosphoglycerate dehydrogenase [Flavobacteriaceae bacterium]|nr:3-phosphoglycerate dehydrogenase [Flavobacteriaceae bacterium]|tara:strand:- start:302 stop:1252 length:951 start_codon:yes stop_codon:yes gene_type:complete
MKILANDGISDTGIDLLSKAGFEVITVNIAQNQLIKYINNNNVSCLLVRSATQARKDLIDSCPKLKLIGRGGVGMDNIDVDYAKSKNIHVINTPAASSSSVAELVIAHLYGCVRFLYDSNRNMPLEGDKNFKNLKKIYSKGIELRGKTLGIIGFGRIGQEVAKLALGIGMKVIASDKFIDMGNIKIDFYNNESMSFEVKTQSLNSLYRDADFITLHIPSQREYIINKESINLMKDGVGIINAARGGIINETDLIEALDSKKVSFAAFDTFENEPNPNVKLLMHPKVSLSPHIGAATGQAQDRIGEELANQIINLFQ